MRVEREWLRAIIFGRQSARRFTQESPILPDVWLVAGCLYCLNPKRRIDFLLTPHRDHSASELGQELQKRLKATSEPRPVQREGGDEQVITRAVWTLAVSQVAVAVSLTLEELITVALPLTPWWRRNRKDLLAPPGSKGDENPEVRWMRRIVGTLLLAADTRVETEPIRSAESLWFSNSGEDTFEDDVHGDDPLLTDPAAAGPRATQAEFARFLEVSRNEEEHRRRFAELATRALALAGDQTTLTMPGAALSREEQEAEDARCAPQLLWSVGINRRARSAIYKSVSATKADAARRLFNVKCGDLKWAVVDTGIDARHQAFRRPENDPPGAQISADTHADPESSRVTASYDFTRLRKLITLDSHPSTGPSALDQDTDLELADRRFKEMRLRLRAGRALDWSQLEPLLRITHQKDVYRPPTHDHGTHVAGILGGCQTVPKHGEGICPDIELYDLRVLDDDGKGDEFSIIAALQFIRYLNATSDQVKIHGVNLSLSLLHDVENFACGRTPICEECERLVASGVVVVAAAGNRGFERVLTGAGELDAYRSISITDPGNAEGIITVGATHRFEPHTYGVSYFSSRGPTGDGRIKPDVLAPGERVYSCEVGGGYVAKDGTSMAAPHVSGVAAMLMARHREFLGQPLQVKKILMKTATDLGRERYFQGAGMIDALRALQAV